MKKRGRKGEGKVQRGDGVEVLRGLWKKLATHTPHPFVHGESAKVWAKTLGCVESFSTVLEKSEREAMRVKRKSQENKREKEKTTDVLVMG